jgi:pimeloyl-ACP methyl ester carboxylesterase
MNLAASTDSGQGSGYWKTYLARSFERITRSPGYTFDDRRRITVPTLILTGDRDQFCSVEEGVTAYRMLQDGELAVLPDTGHLITRPSLRQPSSSSSASWPARPDRRSWPADS